jgi:hypothetical protein
MFGFVGDGACGRLWFLDDVSIVDVNASSVELLQNPSFDNSTTALTDWIQYCTSTCTPPPAGAFPGQVTTGSNCTSTNCYMDHCCGGAIDFLSQSFSTIIGHFHKISFWIVDIGATGSPNGATKAYVDLY